MVTLMGGVYMGLEGKSVTPFETSIVVMGGG